MRIVNRAAFLAMPSGTVFCKFEPMVMDDLRIKGETVIGVDFLYQSIHDAWPENINDTTEWADVFMRGVETGDDLGTPDLDSEFRDGQFDEGQLFIVYSDADVEAFIARLTATLERTK